MSPEGQAFVLEMYAAWRDWQAAGSPGVNSALSLRSKAGDGWMMWKVGFSVVVGSVVGVGVGVGGVGGL